MEIVIITKENGERLILTKAESLFELIRKETAGNRIIKLQFDLINVE